MKTDITRRTFHKENHYDKVTMQQGRVQLDADWNEQADIHIYRSRVTSRDVIGKTGAPTEDRGFEIIPHTSSLEPYATDADAKRLRSNSYTIGAGRYYVDGILCENEKDVDATNQPDLPLLLLCAWEDMSTNNSETRTNAISRILNFLRDLIPTFDKDIRSWGNPNEVNIEISNDHTEKKLVPKKAESAEKYILFKLESGSACRATIGFDNGRVKILELVIVSDPYDNNKIKLAYSPAIPFSTRKYLVYLDVWEREITSLDNRRLLEVALGGPDTTTRTKIVWQVKILPIDLDSDKGKLSERNNGYEETQREPEKERDVYGIKKSHQGDCYCESQFEQWDQLISPHKGTLQARLKPASFAGVQPGISSGRAFTGPQHQLYRVEVHEEGPIGSGATFKWSRDNAIVASKIVDIASNENKITIENIGRDNSRFGYPIGSWIEITDDRHELWQIPGTLVEVTDVKDNVIYFKPNATTSRSESITIDNYPTIYNPKVRRWDSIGSIKLAEENEGYIDLEHEIQVRFGEPSGHSATFRTGDYWLIPARRTEGSKGIDWPIDEAGNPSSLTPEGINHHFSKLALISVAPYEEENVPEAVKEIEERRLPKGQRHQQQQQQQLQQRKEEEEHGTSSTTSHEAIAEHADCRRFFLPLNSLTLRYVSGDGQEDLPDNVLPTELMAQVTSGDVPVGGVTVKFTIEKGGGWLQRFGMSNNKDREYSVISDDHGFVRCQWGLGKIGNPQQVKATIVDLDSITPSVDLPIYFNANISQKTNDIAKTGELELNLKNAAKSKDGFYRNIKHNIDTKPGKNGPPFVELGLVSLIDDEPPDRTEEPATTGHRAKHRNVQFIRENLLPDLPKRRLLIRAVNIGPETFDVSIDKKVIDELSTKAKRIRLRWWAIPCQEQEPQFV